MARSSLALDSSWVDYYGDWSALIEPLMAPLEQSTCHAPRYVLMPDANHQVVQSGGKIEYNFRLVPGSIIIGLWLTPGFTIQLRDIDLEHDFFQEPVKSDFLITQGAQFGRFPSITLLPTPHPVVGDALYSLQVWGTVGTQFVAVLLVAEVTDCPVR
jgi:hypothetical protein